MSTVIDDPNVGPVHSIGVKQPLVDGPEKVSGKALYTADFVTPQTLVGRILRTPHAHARIVSIDTSRARVLPGVKAVVSGEDCAANFGVLPIAMNEWALARGKVRYRGEPVAAVAADLGAGEAEMLAQIIDEEEVRRDAVGALPPVHRDRE